MVWYCDLGQAISKSSCSVRKASIKQIQQDEQGCNKVDSLSKLRINIMNILLLTACLLVLLTAHNHYTCVFEKNNRDLREQSRKAKPDVSSVPPTSQRMLLTITRNPIRITYDASNFNTVSAGTNGTSTTTTTNLAFVLKSFKVAISFYITRLQVYPLTTISAPSVCVDYNTPPNDQQYGISASDLHIYTTYITDKTQSYGATGKSCKYYGDGTATLPDATLQVGRPTMGRIIFNTYSLVDTQSSLTNRLFQSVISTACHELLHILGMDSTLYSSWLDSDQASATFSNVYTATTVSATANISSSRPTNTKFLTTPNVKSWAQTFFACNTLPGMILQNEDGTGLGGGSHWQRVAMYDQLMTGTSLGSVKYFSALSFSALRDMGWYTVDAKFNETSNYGYQKGCDFVYDACYSGTSFEEFCNAATQSSISVCQSSFYSKAICSNAASLMADGCGLYGPYFNCIDPASQNDGYQSYTRQVYGTTSFCVKSTLGTVALPSTVQSRCYPYVCNTNNVVFTVGTNTITCLSSQTGVQKTLSAFTGYLQCPDFNQFCTYSRKTCPNWCSQNGYCMGGVCNCISGYYGDDCSQTICTTGLFYNSLTSTCVATCPSGYFANSYNSACNKCASSCQQCFGEPTVCTGCISSATEPQYYYNGNCSSQCPSGTFATGYNCSVCDSTVSFCATCDGSASNCTSCASGKFLSEPGYGSCGASCPSSGTYSVSDLVNYVCVSTCSSNLVLVNSGSNNNTCQYCSGSTFKLTSNSSCVTSCPNYYYANTTIWLCSQCDSSCLTCNGGYAENCTSCSPTATLRYLLLKMCWSVCPGGYYSNDTACACQICPVNLNCGNCTYQNSSQSVLCTSCAYGYFLQGSTCSPSCNSNQFAYLGNNSCVSCDLNCLTCIGPGSTSCASCTLPLLYVSNLTGGYCISSCPTVGFYISGSTRCVACDLTCLNCSDAGASSCTACYNGSYLNEGYCRLVCPPTKYPNTALSICSSCDGSCTYCFGPTINNCTGCMTGMVLFNFSCTLTCPTGYTVNQWNVCFEHMVQFGLILALLLVVPIF